MQIRIFDLRDCRVTKQGPMLTFRTAAGVQLSNVAENEASTARERMLLCLNAALDSKIRTPAGLEAVALLNPVTGETAVGPLPTTVSYETNGLEVPACGLSADASETELLVDGQRIFSVRPMSSAVPVNAIRVHSLHAEELTRR